VMRRERSFTRVQGDDVRGISVGVGGRGRT